METDPEQAIERDVEELEHRVEQLGDDIDDAKDHLEARAAEAGAHDEADEADEPSEDPRPNAA